jgi:hypothetical protein
VRAGLKRTERERFGGGCAVGPGGGGMGARETAEADFCKERVTTMLGLTIYV